MNIAEQYANVNAMTAGHLKSHQLLIERAMLLSETYRDGDSGTQVKLQNILVQLQMALNIRYEEARVLHGVFAKLWDVVETGNEEGILYVKEVLATHLDTLKKLQGIPTNPTQ